MFYGWQFLKEVESNRWWCSREGIKIYLCNLNSRESLSLSLSLSFCIIFIFLFHLNNFKEWYFCSILLFLIGIFACWYQGASCISCTIWPHEELLIVVWLCAVLLIGFGIMCGDKNYDFFLKFTFNSKIYLIKTVNK